MATAWPWSSIACRAGTSAMIIAIAPVPCTTMNADDVVTAVEIALHMTERGADLDDPFPSVRAGVAYGSVVNRLGDVFGPTVNIAARLTSVARPGTVVVDLGAYEALSGRVDDDAADDPDHSDHHGLPGHHGLPADEVGDDAAAYHFRRLRRVSVKGYSRLRAWAVRRAPGA